MPNNHLIIHSTKYKTLQLKSGSNFKEFRSPSRLSYTELDKLRRFFFHFESLIPVCEDREVIFLSGN